MRVAIVGAGAVGRSIAGELLSNGHTVMLIEKDGRKVRTRAVPGAEWVQADACEVSSLEEAQLATCDVVVAATGDDKANLVVSLLAKTEFAVNRVVARVKDPRNEWLYTEAWGVDVAVSTPRVLARSEEHTSELQSRQYLVCRLLLEKKKQKQWANLYSGADISHTICFLL